MKKIVALVLSLVMALSLATVAFAEINAVDYKLWRVDGNKVVDTTGTNAAGGPWALTEKAAWANPKGDNGNVEYFIYGDNAEFYIACDQKDASHIVTYRDGHYRYVKMVTSAEDANYNFEVTEQKATSAKADCTTTHYLDDGYLFKGEFYVKSDAAGAVPAKFGNTIIKVIAAPQKVVYASHVLGEAVKNDKTGWYEAKCLVCGATFALTDSLDVLAKNNIKKADTFEYVEKDAYNVIADNNKAGKYAFPVGTKFAASYQFAWQLTAGTETKPADTKPGVDSAKTFDAGIAMYVGMSLLSVAGSAVVIGKKKEF